MNTTTVTAPGRLARDGQVTRCPALPFSLGGLEAAAGRRVTSGGPSLSVPRRDHLAELPSHDAVVRLLLWERVAKSRHVMDSVELA
jgi:hypothetical protein